MICIYAWEELSWPQPFCIVASPDVRSGSPPLRRVPWNALLASAVVGSGIAASRLSPNDAGLQLLENAAATSAALVAILLEVGPVSGAHLNPVVTLTDRHFGEVRNGEAAADIAAEVSGGAFGAVVANLMFSMPAVELSTMMRSSGGIWLAEMVATFGVLLIIFGGVRSGQASAAPFAVGATFAGIKPSSMPPFVAAQLVGAGLAVLAIRVLHPNVSKLAADLPRARSVNFVPIFVRFARDGSGALGPNGRRQRE